MDLEQIFIPRYIGRFWRNTCTFSNNFDCWIRDVLTGPSLPWGPLTLVKMYKF